MPLGVKALNTYPLKSAKRDKGLRDVPITFAGVTVKPGDWVYADKASALAGRAGCLGMGSGGTPLSTAVWWQQFSLRTSLLSPCPGRHAAGRRDCVARGAVALTPQV